MNLKRFIKPQNIFLALALIYGTAFLIVIPPFMISDEHFHFYKTYYTSEGHLLPDKNNYFFPESIDTTMQEFFPLNYVYNNKTAINNIPLFLNLPLNPDKKIYSDISNIAIYLPIPYLANSIMMATLRLFNLSPLLMMYLGRLINLFIWVILVYFAIKITPVHKWVFLMLALMPMTLNQAASLSADSFTIGLSFLTIAFFFNYSFSNRAINSKDIIIMFILIFTLALSKQGYIPLLLLLLMIPIDKFNNSRIRILAFTLIGSITLLFTGIWDYIFKDSYVAIVNPAISASNQIFFILQNPLQFGYIFLNTLNLKFQFYLISFVGIFGWLQIPLPEIMVYTYLAALIIVALLDKNKLVVNKVQKSVSFFTFLIISFMVFLFEYTTWTPVGASLIEGVMGRYFIPAAPLFFLLFYNRKSFIQLSNKNIDFKLPKNAGIIIAAFIAIFLTITLRMLIITYYA
ncbi:MAG: DUF2142 domain-containing protein [Methanobacterium sp.]